MDYIFTPWRYAYVTGASGARTCIFCDALSSKNDREVWIVYRGRYNFVILNAFPYTSGHVMIVPNEHVDELQKLSSDAAHEMMDLSQKTEAVL
ncbi:MAG TPA: HIT domain-containing protein, partial [Terriglobales bacterium]|nr:HIT domain-containing protein [Terriglobales bacterium]